MGRGFYVGVVEFSFGVKFLYCGGYFGDFGEVVEVFVVLGIFVEGLKVGEFVVGNIIFMV